ncbi:restriction endonuclease subunit S [Mycoplasmopsis cynos]|uniref:restriction endonuclease subunit S n=1 Tax=Mycoplasmopsis cynos TaxID=171284 RepID=UPI002AFDD3E7|nr:restriction endonuclease subunit S [Mycoplasmopsis cynos]WQQ13872.1 restriction endonuclease subunit S [Mycoplasmopsis cynos]
MSKNNMVPSIRFKEFTNAWEQERLGNLSDIKSGDFVIKIKQSPIFKFPVYNGGSTYTGFYKEFNFLGPKVVISSRGAAGSVNYVKSNFWAGNSVFVLDFMKDKMVNLFFSYILLKNLEFKMRSMISSTGIPALSVKDVCKIKLFLCNLNEQQKIGNIFSLINSLITLHQRKLNALENLKKTLLEKMFPSENSVFPSIRFKEFTNAWEQEKIENIFTITRGYVLGKEKISLEKNAYFKYPVFSSQTGNNGLMGYYNSYLFDKAITWTTDGIYAGDVNYRDEKFYCANVCGVLLNNDGYINLCNAISINKVSKKHVTKVGNPKLMNNVMKEILFSYSNNLKEQTNISMIFSNINSLITLHQRELKILKNFKKSLFQNMIVGKKLTILPAKLTKMTNSWEQERLGKISNFSTGKGITISQSLSKGFPIVSGGIDVMGYYSKYNRMENTITIARAGKCGYVSFISEKFYLNDKCFSLDLKENINSYFLFNLLKKNEKRIMELGSNSSIPTITSTSLKAVDIFRTSYDEQKAIAILFVSINSLITLHQRKLNALENLKKTLLEKMFV